MPPIMANSTKAKISKVKVFKKWVKLQGHRVKIIVPTERSYHKDIKALALTVQKL